MSGTWLPPPGSVPDPIDKLKNGVAGASKGRYLFHAFLPSNPRRKLGPPRPVVRMVQTTPQLAYLSQSRNSVGGGWGKWRTFTNSPYSMRQGRLLADSFTGRNSIFPLFSREFSAHHQKNSFPSSRNSMFRSERESPVSGDSRGDSHPSRGDSHPSRGDSHPSRGDSPMLEGARTRPTPLKSAGNRTKCRGCQACHGWLAGLRLRRRIPLSRWALGLRLPRGGPCRQHRMAVAGRPRPLRELGTAGKAAERVRVVIGKPNCLKEGRRGQIDRRADCVPRSR